MALREDKLIESLDSKLNTPLFYLDAKELVALIRRRKISVREVMSAFLERIDRVNPKINAICTLRPSNELLKEAQRADDHERHLFLVVFAHFLETPFSVFVVILIGCTLFITTFWRICPP